MLPFEVRHTKEMANMELQHIIDSPRISGELLDSHLSPLQFIKEGTNDEEKYVPAAIVKDKLWDPPNQALRTS